MILFSNRTNKIISAVTVLILCLCACTACSGSDGDSSSKAQASSSQTESTNVVTETSTADSSDTENASSEEETYTAGENLTALLEKLDGGYTIKTESVYSDDSENTAEETYILSGDNYYMRRTRSDSDTAIMLLDSKLYEIDYTIGAYSVSDTDSDYQLPYSSRPVFNQIYELQLDQTHNRTPIDIKGYTAEEYTYAGDTYMTVIVLYFTEDGEIDKYTEVYTVEGQDEITETVQVLSVEGKSDESVFDTESLSALKDFSAMTEDERLGFCQETCGKFGVSTDNMYEMDITTDDFKKIDFDTFTELIYTYGNQKEVSDSEQ